ncbi:Protein OXIDATIVE STRESS 3 LIKE 1 [Cardamine amara subsp. amara]|uniref:Protein OXIDATIVE STRESS 3 LIKE 1 n=1 Tax=Cardamine amara subsp. amara TaxID=228776 RepID=A0ABD1ABS5_CARAN
MSFSMDRVEAYVFNFSGENSDQSPSDSSSSSPSSSASSSIGRNSDDGRKSSEDGGDDAGENEVESPYKGPLEMMESLEQVLPVRKGISKYYNGKSKSFTNLAAGAASALTSSSSMKNLAKPENPYSRRRRNLLCHQIWENNKTTPRGGISKKTIMNSSRSALTLAMAVATGVMTGEGSSSGGDSSPGSSPTTSGSPPRQRHHHHHHHQMMLPPLYPRSQGSFGNLKSSQSTSLAGFCAWKSYSVADFPRCFPATASGIGLNDS